MLDLGAGTGKLSATVLAAGHETIAVEPDAAMLAELSTGIPQATAFLSAAEAIPLPDADVDAAPSRSDSIGCPPIDAASGNEIGAPAPQSTPK